ACRIPAYFFYIFGHEIYKPQPAKSMRQSLIILGITVMLSAVRAQTTNFILQTDFDGDAGEGNFNDFYGYCVAGSSAGTALAGFEGGGILPGVGVDGTSANSESPDYTLLPDDPNWTNSSLAYVYADLGNGTLFGAPMTAITPTAVMSSFILSADLQVTGLLPGLTNADVTISKVQFLDTNGIVLFDFSGDAGNVGSNFVHIAVPLSSLAYGGANGGDATHPITDFTNAAIVSSIAGFTIEFAVEGLPVGVIGGAGTNLISPPFGFTDTGTLVVDNVQLIQTGNTVPTPTQEKLIWQANFDNTFPTSGYGFNFRDGANGAAGIVSTNMGGGVGGSNSLEYAVDLSSWSSSPPVSYSGFGVGAQVDPIPYQLTSNIKASYRVYFSAKAGGLANGASTNISAAADLLFLVPPGAESPSNASPAVVFDINPTLTLTTNWQSFVFDGAASPIGVNNGGSQTLFDQYLSQVDEMQVQVSTEGSPDIGLQFGYDSNATIDIDDIKVVELVPALPPVTVVNTNNQVEVFWADPPTGGTAQLQSSTNVAGPYLNIPGAASDAASPYTVPTGSQQQFFRTIWIP
ncbi:MAG: hypothetical protein ACREC8_06560, partial [Limisphaerales bacterium]